MDAPLLMRDINAMRWNGAYHCALAHMREIPFPSAQQIGICRFVKLKVSFVS